MLNKVFLIGNLVADPEIRYTPQGTETGQIRLACTEKWKKDGETKEDTLFIACQLWDKQATNAQQYLHKGDRVCVEGKLQIREYEQDGVKKWFTSVRVSKIVYLKTKQQKASDMPENPNDNFDEFDESDVPFA